MFDFFVELIGAVVENIGEIVAASGEAIVENLDTIALSAGVGTAMIAGALYFRKKYRTEIEEWLRANYNGTKYESLWIRLMGDLDTLESVPGKIKAALIARRKDGTSIVKELILNKEECMKELELSRNKPQQCLAKEDDELLELMNS